MPLQLHSLPIIGAPELASAWNDNCEVIHVANFRAMYFQLFNSISAAIELLQQAQRDGEQAYLEESSQPELLPKQPPEEE